MTAATIITALNEIFAPMDVEVLAATHEWAKGRERKFKEFVESDEGKLLKKTNYFAYDSRLFSIAGGVNWYRAIISGGIASFVEENHVAMIQKRNRSIAKKLDEAGVSDVISQAFVKSEDGFDGVFEVNTSAGKKRVTIKTVQAGGYSVQCLHLRVLVKIK